MKLICLMPARNEGWVIGLTARAVLQWCDELVVLDHASNDNTRDVIVQIQSEYPGRVHLIINDNPEWREAEHRQRLLETGRRLGGTHFALIDADEILTGNLIDEIVPKVIEPLLPGQVAQIPWIMCWRSSLHYRCDPGSHWTRSYISMSFNDKPELHWRTRSDGYCFHHRHPYEATHQIPWKEIGREGGLMHLQHASWPRLLAKQALYKMLEVVRWPGRETAAEVDHKYNKTVSEAGLALKEIPRAWWHPYISNGFIGYLNLDAEPWQAKECRKLWMEYGPEKFKGLNLYGVVG